MHLPRVWAQLDLAALVGNLAACRKLLGDDCAILGVVKADAYGHGAVPISQALERAGISMLGVGDSHEAITLRQHGVRTPLLVLGAVVDLEIPELIQHRVTPMIHSPDRIGVFDAEARRLGVRLGVHLLIDTGMSRLGVAPEHAADHLQAIVEAPHLQLQGVGTHLASPLTDPEFTREQLRRFERVLAAARRLALPIACRHVASSQALGRYPESHLDMVRIGGLLYGIAPGVQLPGIRPVLSLHAQVVYLRDLPPDTPVSYQGCYRTTRRTRVATLAVGYHDGYHFQLTGRAQVLVRGARAPVIGRVTMDYTMADVTDIPDVRVGDRVTLLGRDGDQEITALDLAAWAGTVPYEIPSHLGSRVRRFTTDDATAVTAALPRRAVTLAQPVMPRD